MKILYYTVNTELDIQEDYTEVGGNKTIYVYGMENNVPMLRQQIECDLSDNSEELIKEKYTNQELQLIEL